MHRFGHISIPTTDFKKAKNFFGKVFGWTFEDAPEIRYVFFRAASAPHGGFYLVKKMPKKAQVNVYIEVDDIDAKLKEIRKARGKVVVKKVPMGPTGWVAQFATPDGCYLSLWQAVPPKETAVETSPVR
jgi:predicted enzyme related to lactoylglutathione lyase